MACTTSQELPRYDEVLSLSRELPGLAGSEHDARYVDLPRSGVYAHGNEPPTTGHRRQCFAGILFSAERETYSWPNLRGSRRDDRSGPDGCCVGSFLAKQSWRESEHSWPSAATE